MCYFTLDIFAKSCVHRTPIVIHVLFLTELMEFQRREYQSARTGEQGSEGDGEAIRDGSDERE